MQFLVNPPKKGFLSAAIMLSRHCLVAASSQSSAVFQIPHWPWAVSSLAHMTSISRQHSAKNYPWLHCRGGGDGGGGAAAAAMAAAAPTSAAGKSQLWPSRKIFQTLSPFLTQSLLSLSRLDTPTQIARVRTPNVISLTITFQLRISTALARANENKKKILPNNIESKRF